MLFMVTWKGQHDQWIGTLRYWSSLTPAQRADVGKGVKLIGRWHDLGSRAGVAIFKADDAVALHGYATQWSPFLDLDIAPVVSDEESAVIAAEVVAAQPAS